MQYHQLVPCMAWMHCPGKKKSHSSRRFLSRCEQYELVPPEARIAQSMDAQTKRQLKIQRFQKDKQSRARLNQIDSLHETLDDSKDEGSGDLEREAWLIRIELAVMKAAEQSSQIKQVLCHCKCSGAFLFAKWHIIIPARQFVVIFNHPCDLAL